MSKPLDWIADELAKLEHDDLRRWLTERSGAQTPNRITLDGQQLINFSSNDYLGIAAELGYQSGPENLLEHGWGSGASPLVTGRSTAHARLEKELAEFKRTEAALLFGSGYAANIGTIAALAGKGDVIFSDEKNHASIIDGCRLSGAIVRIYPHKDIDYLSSQIQQATMFRRRFIVTDSLFSMDGDFAPLPDLCQLASDHDAIMIVDEAHATGVFGERGSGLCEHLGVEDHVPVRIGTLSKGLGSIGGFVAGSQPLIDWLANRARSYVFSTAPPAAVALAGSAALRLVQDSPERRTNLLQRAQNLRLALAELGWNTGQSESQIVPVIVGDAAGTMAFAQRLKSQGFLVPGIRPPTVPAGECLLRISLSAAHSDEDLEALLSEFRHLSVE